MDTEKLKQFVALSKQAKEVGAEHERLKDEAAALEADLLLEFQEAGMSNARVDGVTVYIRRDLWAGAAKKDGVDKKGNPIEEGDYETTCDALLAAGLEMFVQRRFNTQTVSAWVRELPEGEDGMPILPPELEGKLRVTEKYGLRTRQAR